MDINNILRIYLGTKNGGFDPIGQGEDRLKQAFPRDWERMLVAIEPYLGVDHRPDWSLHDLIEEGEIFAEILRKRFPELDDISVKALANRFTYGWK